MDLDLFQLISQNNFIDIAKNAAITLLGHARFHGQIINTQDHVLSWRDYRLSTGGFEQVLAGQHQFAGFHDSFFGKRHVHSHLITVKVSVESCGHQGMKLNSATLNQNRFKSLNTKTVQGWSTVKQYRTIFDDFFEHFPYFRSVAFDVFLCALDIVGVFMFIQTGDNKGSVKFQGHSLRQTALVQLQVWTNNDN